MHWVRIGLLSDRGAAFCGAEDRDSWLEGAKLDVFSDIESGLVIITYSHLRDILT